MTIEEQLKTEFKDLVSRAFFEKREGSNFLSVELFATDFDEVIEISRKISNHLDIIDKSDDEYILDVYSKGTDHEIDLNDLEKFLNENVMVILKTSIQDKDEFTGELVEDQLEYISVNWNAKGQFRKQKIEKKNIKTIKLFAKIGKA